MLTVIILSLYTFPFDYLHVEVTLLCMESKAFARDGGEDRT
jgi:hypothetical protein